MRHCFLGRWIYLPVSERFRLVWKCRLFDYSTYIQFYVHWHGGQCLRRLVPNYAVVFRLGWVYLPVSRCHTLHLFVLFISGRSRPQQFHIGKGMNPSLLVNICSRVCPINIGQEYLHRTNLAQQRFSKQLYGLVWFDLVWFNFVWFGLVWFDSSTPYLISKFV